MHQTIPLPPPSLGKTVVAAALCAVLPLMPLTATSPDRDGDGNSDIWQTHFAAPSLNPDGDADGDGETNGEEETAGTNPLDPSSFFRIEQIELVDPPLGEDFARIHFQGVAGKQYQAQECPDLEPHNWVNVGPATLALADGPTFLTAPLHEKAARHFYRVLVGDIDNDRDGLSASEEFTIGTSDDNPNTGGGRDRDDCDAALDWLASNDLGIHPNGEQRNLREVDVAFLQSGTLGQLSFTFLVTAAGTGGWHQLASWNLSSATANPSLLHTTPPVEGWHPKVASLPGNPNLEGQPRFVTGTIRANGDLFLSSRQLNLGGAFTHHDSVGYGSNAGVEVHDYDLAVRPFADRSLVTHYHVVTPVIVKPSGGGSTELRVLSWRVDASTGALTGLHDSGPLPVSGLPTGGTGAHVEISHLEGIQYVVTYTDQFGRLNNRFVWAENGDGQVVYGGGENGGWDIHGDDFLAVTQAASSLAKVTANGFLTANRDRSTGELGLSVWERRAEGFLNYEPYRITDNTVDLGPAKGVYPDAPNLTDGWDNIAQAGGFASEALAVGDFDGDGRDDLAVGTPGQKINGMNNVGAVYIVRAGSKGITDQPVDQTWSQDTAGINGVPELGDRFGAALAVGDFNNDGHDDLAVGAPDEDVANITSGGAVHIIYGTPFGLSAAGNQIVVQEDLGQVTGAFDYFGAVLTTGDFNGDGRDDLAVAAHSRDIGGVSGGGAVYVLWGGAGGLSTAGSAYLHQNVTGIMDSVEEFDNYGRALTAGDFNGDGNDDLAVGIPFENIGSTNNAGAVQIHYGSATLGFNLNNFISQGGFQGGDDIRGAVEELDLFGRALAAGDFNNDGADDLAIGAPGEDDGATENAGAVHVLYGTIFGLTPINNLLITQDEFNPTGGATPSASETGDDFGAAMVAYDFDNDGYSDLAVGAPHEGIGNSVPDAGAVFEIRGSATGLTSAGSNVWHQGSTQSSNVANGSSKTGDRYGETLAAGDFDANGRGALAIGIPRKDREDDNNEGGVHILPSNDSGFSLALDEEWFPRLVEKVRGMVTDLAWEDAGGIGAGTLFSHDFSNEWVHIASSTKCMTLLLAVEAIENGQVNLWDDVDVSELAAETGGSAMPYFDAPSAVPPTVADLGPKTLDENGDGIAFLATDDTLPLNLLLAGMMMRSCNKSSVAIGQHVAAAVEGDPDAFIEMMNQRALDLGMTSPALDAAAIGTRFGHPAHGCVTTPQGLITLLREGAKHPLFLQLASREIYGDLLPNIELCGTDAMGDPKCNNPFGNIQSLSGYLGRLAWKGGNGGGWWSSGQADNVPAQPSGINWCSTSQVGIVERAGRTLLMALQQTGDNGKDTKALLDFGFQKVFTPDHLAALDYPAPGGIVGPDGPIRVKDFAIDTISSRLAVTAVIDDFEELRLQIWDTNFTTGAITARGNATATYALLDGARWSSPALVRLASVPTTQAIGDYFSANLDGDHLDLAIWRVGETP